MTYYTKSHRRTGRSNEPIHEMSAVGDWLNDQEDYTDE